MSGFIKELEGSKGIFCVFEDDGETGYVYIYIPRENKIVTNAHVYTRSSTLQPTQDDIRIIWFTDNSKCSVYLFDQLQATLKYNKL